MNIVTTVTQNPDGTHTIDWVSSINQGEKLHDINVGIRTPTQIVDGIDVSTGKGIYVWSDWNNGPGKPNEMTPEFAGERTLNLTSYIGEWTTLRLVAYICQFDTPESPYDQYTCKNAEEVTISNTANTTSPTTQRTKKGRGK